MSEMRDELADLVADVRAALEANRALGVVDESVLDPVVEAVAPADPPASAPTSSASTKEQPALIAVPPGSTLFAPGAESLADVRQALGDCTRCGLCEGRRNIVFGVGDPEADLMIVGEAPGFNEDRVGEPFVGAAGEMLDKMLVHVLGLQREQVYIANVVKCRPPDNRNPAPAEVASCLPFLMRQIAAIQPRLILVLGSVALKNLLDTTDGITRSRGHWRELHGIPVMPTFHPAYLLRNPAHKRLTFNDLKAVRARYDSLDGKR